MNAINGGGSGQTSKRANRRAGAQIIEDTVTGSAERAISLCKMVAERCSYRKNVNGVWKEVPSRTGDFIEELDQRDFLELIRYIAPVLWQALNELLPQMYRKLPFVREALGINHEFLALLDQLRPAGPVVQFFGFDTIGRPGRWKINDLNTDITFFVGFLDQIISCFRQQMAMEASRFPFQIPEGEGQDRFETVEPSFFQMLAKISERSDPNIAILTSPDDPYAAAVGNAIRFGQNQLAKMKSGSSLFKVTAKDLSYSAGELSAFGRRIDVIYRAVKARVLLEKLKDSDPLFRALSNTANPIPMVNPLESFLVGSKASFFFLTWAKQSQEFLERNLQQHTRQLLQNLFVPSTLALNGEVYLPDGEVRNLSSYCSETVTLENGMRTKRWKLSVFKKTFSYGGWDIFIGRKLREWQFRKLLEQFSIGSWTIEPELKHQQAWVVVGEQNSTGSWFASKKLLNLINRFYLLRTHPNQVWAESFGNIYSKVNAAGWSFPVAMRKPDGD